MLESSLLNGIAKLIGSVAAIAIVLTAFGLMLGILKPADAFKRIGIIVATVIALLELPRIVVHAWSTIPWWRRLALIAVGLAIRHTFASRRERRHRGRI